MPTSHFQIPSPEELHAYANVVSQAFSATVPDALAWLQKVGIEHNRVLVEGGEVVGGLVRYGMGQWYGGRRVSMVGIAGVAIDPTQRGLGIGTRLMREAVAAFADEGFDLATLYPATQGIYRRVGFEQAGSRFKISVPTAQLRFDDRSLSLRPEGPGDLETIHSLHRRHGSRGAGCPDRGEALWQRLRSPRTLPAPRCYLVDGPQGAEGYCFIASRDNDNDNDRQELIVSDLVADTHQAATRLLTFLGDHASMADEVIWYGSAADPLLALLPEQRHRVSVTDAWMLRILDVPRALESRGYPDAISARLELEIIDDVIESNAGRFVVDVSEGRAEIRAGGSGGLRLHVRGLAALYSGYLTPAALRLAGLADGEPHALDQAAAVFSGPPPAMSDFY